MLTIFWVLACTSVFAKVEDAEFQQWMSKHNIKIQDPDSVYPIWKKNAVFVQQHNSLGLSHTVSLNKFAHMTLEELVGENVFQLKINESPQATVSEMEPLPPSVDWRTKGAVTPVFNQGQCGSAAAFAIVDSVSSYGFFENGKLQETSLDEYVDCCMNGSCNGGFFDVADYNCIARFGGLACTYPVNANHTCKSKDVKPCVAVKGGKQVTPSGDEKALAEAVVKQPIAVAIDAGHTSFQLYSSGVYYEPSCSSTQLDHAVLVVGYGTENGEDYWLVKNSWGTDWGMNGYIMMARNKGNNCGIATEAIYPY